VTTVSTVQLDQTVTQESPEQWVPQERLDQPVDLDETERMEHVDAMEIQALPDHTVLLANLDLMESWEPLA